MPKHFALMLLILAQTLPALAQETPSADSDGSSEQVEESDEAFRRRMELEDARRRDPGYTPPAAGAQKPEEKIDELPAASQDNIRDQLLDIIMDNGEWEPSDALEDYPYEPTEAARADRELMEQELEAWDEQVEKYHQREAEAFGAHRGPPPGAHGASPGDPSGDGAQAGAQAGTGGKSGAEGQAGSAGSYQPYAVNRDDPADEVSTAGAQQSALEFLRGQSGTASTAASGSTADAEPSESATTAAAVDASAAQASEAERSSDPEAAAQRDIPGIIAIEDLDKLEGAVGPDEPEDADPPR